MKHLFFFICIFSAVISMAQPGTLDNTFGTGGKVIENTSAPYTNILDMVVQTDGKIVVLAEAWYTSKNRIVLLRYGINGTLDSTFDSDGIVISSVSGPDLNDYGHAFKLQADGKILVCGSTEQSSNGSFVLRYTTTGSLDTSFGGTGILFIPEPNIKKINNLVTMANGDIFLVATYSATAELALIKLNSNGTRNTSFGSNGIAFIDATTSYDPEYKKIEVQSDGKFIIGGNPHPYGNPGQTNLLVVRVNANGTIDNTYGTNGTIESDAGPADPDDFFDMALQTDGRLVVSGYNQGDIRFNYAYLIRFNTNGTKDNSFGNSGVQLINSASFTSIGQISLQSDNKILMAGFIKNMMGNYNMAVARLNTNGSFDNTFDSDGIALLPVNNDGSYGFVPYQQTDGKILVAGIAGNGNAFSVTIGRLTGTGQPDNSINTGGTAITYIGSGHNNESGNTILVQPDQKIVNARQTDNGLAATLSLSRHLADGAPDTGFGTNGRTILDLPGYVNKAFLGILNNGKFMAVCDYQDFISGAQSAVFRFNSNGHSDSSFGTNGKLFFNTSPGNVNTVHSAIIQADGKVLLVCNEFISYTPYTPVNYLIRLNADGSYDITFNGTGKLDVTPSGNCEVVAQLDGKILLIGHSPVATGFNTTVKRLLANGTTDNSFNNGSPVAIRFETDQVAIQPDGKIVIAYDKIDIARLNADGSFDNSFGTNGYVASDYRFSELEDIKIQPDGKILLCGSSDNSGIFALQVVRLNANGLPDINFGTNGTTIIPNANNRYSNALSMALQADTKILLSGFARNDNPHYWTDFAMVRLNSSNVGPIYTFTGNGNWNVAGNWSNGIIPPATLPAGSTIFIDSVTGGECVLTTTQHVSAGATFAVKTGKKFRIAGGLILQ